MRRVVAGLAQRGRLWVDRRLYDGRKGSVLFALRAAVRVRRRDVRLQRLLIRALLAAPTSAPELAEARRRADRMLGRVVTPANENTFVNVLIRQVGSGGDVRVLANDAAVFAASDSARRFAGFRRVLVALEAAGRVDVAADLADQMRHELELTVYWAAAHGFALRADRVDVAMTIEQELGAQPWYGGQTVTQLVAERLLREQRPGEAASALRAARPTRPAGYSRAMVESLLAVGDDRQALTYLDGTVHQLPRSDEAAFRFDILFRQGHLAEAHQVLDGPQAIADPLSDVRLVRQLRDVLGKIDPEAAALLPARIRALEVDSDETPARVELAARLYFELDDLASIERLADDRDAAPKLGPLGTYAMALSDYCARRWDDALDRIDRLRGTVRHWEAEKLRSRILFERGDDAAAIEHRLANRRSDGEVDEVIYHALLHQRRYDEAFSLYLPRRDRQRLAAAVGDRAEHGPEFAHVGCRAVIMQNGPGDEIQLASTLPELASLSDRLVVVGEPRLHSLLARSFPAVTFVPCRRMSSRRDAGFLATDQPPRATGPLFDLLTAEAFEAIASAQSVVLSRSLQQVSLRWQSPPHHYLAADQPEQRGGNRPRVGVTWRSEFGSAMRAIHYLDVQHLAALDRDDVTLVDLQYDATDDERRHLDSLSRFPVERPAIDLRNDFECTANFLSGLDAVVAVGTTTAELAGALGVPTVLVTPTRFGTWRSIDEAGHDYWHASMRVAVGDVHGDKASSARRAGVLLAELLRR
jgi:hypothetical protein